MSPAAASKARIYTAVAAVIALVIIVAGVLVAVQPLWNQAAEANELAQDQEDKNDTQQAEVNKLKQQFAKIDAYKDLLTTLRTQVPTTLQTQEFQRQFAQVAQDYDLTVNRLEFADSSKVTVTTSEAELVTKGIASEADGGEKADASAPEPTQPAEGESSSTPEAEGGGATANKEVDGPRFVDLYTIPVSIDISGDYHNVLDAIRTLQTSPKRVFVVTGLTGESGSTATTPGAGANADALTLHIEGLIAVLLDPESETSAPDDETIESPTLPHTGGSGNPLNAG